MKTPPISFESGTAMPLPRDETTLKQILEILTKQNDLIAKQSEAIPRQEYERRHLEIQQRYEEKLTDLRVRDAELSAKLDKLVEKQDELRDEVQREIKDAIQKSVQQVLGDKEASISRLWAIVLMIATTIIGGGFGALIEALMHH